MASSQAVVDARLARPARKQISYAELEEIRNHAERFLGEGMIYNVWYNKMSGGDSGHGFESKSRSKTRCDIARDSGYTRADMRIQASAGGVSDTTYVCLFFARGCCPKGYVEWKMFSTCLGTANNREECNYLHRLPRPYEVADQGTDVFGREKYGSYRDDMGGVGSMLRVNKTLYVGRINEETTLSFRRAAANPAESQDDAGATPMSKIVRRHFSEWGELDHGMYAHFVWGVKYGLLTSSARNDWTWYRVCHIQIRSECPICKGSHDAPVA